MKKILMLKLLLELLVFIVGVIQIKYIGRNYLYISVSYSFFPFLVITPLPP
jgi:hypothetical protein